MDILLIQPDETKQRMLPVILRPLALECLGSHLGDHNVEILDLRLEPDALAQALATFRPDLVGVTCTFTCGVTEALALIQTIRGLVNDIIIVVGGTHASIVPEDFLHAGVDFIIRGFGEHTFSALVHRIVKGESLTTIPGIHIVENGALTFTGNSPTPYKWSKNYRTPARALTKKYNHRYTPAPDGTPLALMITSRGCPHKCTFCSAWKLQQGKMQTRDATCIYSELSGVNEEFIYFFDDNTFAAHRVMDQLANLIMDNNLTKRFQAWASADVICNQTPLLQKWATIGLGRLFVGLEGVSDSQLRRVNKRSDISQNNKALEICRQIGIDLSPTFIVDPDFTLDDFLILQDYVHCKGINLPWFNILTPLPGTDLHTMIEQRIVEMDPARFDLMHLTIQPTHMDAEVFIDAFIRLYAQNESWKRVSSHPVYGQFLKNVSNIGFQPVFSRPKS